MGDYDKAIAGLDRGDSAQPDIRRGIHSLRGLAYEKVGEKSKAEEDFARARKLGWPQTSGEPCPSRTQWLAASGNTSH